MACFLPFFCSTRAACILPSRPQILAAVARRACQGWRSHPKGPGLYWPEHDGSLPAIGWLAALLESPLDQSANGFRPAR